MHVVEKTKEELAREVEHLRQRVAELEQAETERKQAEETLQTNAEQYRILTSTSMDGFAVVDVATTRLLDVNEVYSRMLGYSRDELLTMSVSDIVVGEKPEETRKRLQTIMTAGLNRFESRHRCKDGRIIDVEVSNTFLPQTGRFLVFLRDITERKQAEEELREAAEQYRIITNTSIDGFAKHDLDGRILDVNKAYCNMMGYSKDELLKMTVADLEAKATPDEITRQTKKIMKVGSDRFETRHRRKDGYLIDVEVSMTLIRHSGHILVFLHDITERKRMEEDLRESEERFRVLFEGAPDAILLADPESGKILDANAAASRLLSRPHEEIVGMHQSKVHPQHLEKSAREGFTKHQQQISRKQQTTPIESVVLRPDGSEVPVEVLAQKVHIQDKDIIQGIFRDINERKQMEQELRESEERYRAVIESQIDLISRYLPDTTLTFVNDAYCQFYDKMREELIGQSFLSMVAPEFHELILKETGNLVKDSKTISGEYLNYTHDGKECWIQWVVQGITGENGQVVELQAVGRDITERKQTEEALKESEEKFRELAEQTPNMIFINAKGRVVYANKESERRMGYKRKDFYDPNFDFFTLIAPESKDLVKEMYGRNMKGEDVPPYEFTLITEKGERIEAIINPKLIRYEGGSAILGIVTDITERKRIEEKLRENENYLKKAQQIAHFGSWVWDVGANRVAFSDEMFNILGIAREHFDGTPEYTNNLIIAEDRARVQECYEDLLIRHKPASTEYSIVRPDGSIRHLWGIGEIESYKGGKPKRIIGTVLDITERKEAEKALRESEERYRSLFENSLDAILLTAPDGSIFDANPAACQLFGRTVEEITQIGRGGLVDATDPRFDAAIKERTRTGKVHTEITMIRADGSKFPVEITSTIFIDKQGQQRTSMVIRDITERKRTEKKLLESEEKYRELVERANDGITMIQDGIMRYINPRLAEIWGGTAQELKDTPFTDYIDPEELPTVVDRYNRRMQGEDVPSIYETVLRRKDGSKVYVELNAGTITYQEKLADLVFVRDITERKKAQEELRENEERYRFLFENSHTINILIGTDGKILDINEIAAESLGYKKKNIIGKEVLEFVISDQREKVAQQLVQELKGEYTPPLEVDIITKKGTRTLLFTKGHATLFKKGELVGMLLSAVDITERKQAEDELKIKNNAIQSSITAVVIGEFGGSLTYVNPAFLLMWGYDSKTEVIGKPAVDFWHEKEKVHEVIEALLKGENVAGELKGKRKDGSLFDVQLSASIVTNEAGEPSYMMASFVDITERKQAEEELRESEERFRKVVETMKVGLATTDENGILTYVNEYSSGMIGYSEDEMVGHDPTDFYYDEEERKAQQEIFKKRRKGMQDAPTHEVAWRTKDGRKVYSILSPTPFFDAEGRYTGSFAIHTEITDRKQMEEELHESEEKYRSLVESSEDSIYLVDQKCNYIFLNNRHLSRLGVKMKQIIGRPYAEFHSPEESQDFAHKVKTVVKTAQSLSYEYQSQRDNRYFIRTLSPVTFPDGSVIKAITVISKDITERKQAEEANLAHLRFLESMDQFDRAFQGTNDLDQMMTNALGVLLTIFDCERAWLLYPCDPEATSWRVPQERTQPGYPGVFAMGTEIPMDAGTAKMMQTALDSDAPVQYGPGLEYPLPQEEPKRFGIQSQLAMTIYPKVGKPWLFGLHQCSYVRAWTPQEEQILQEIGHRLADSLTSLLIYRDLQESEERFRRVVETMEVGLGAVDENGVHTYVNEYLSKMLGYSMKEMIGRPPHDFFYDEEISKAQKERFAKRRAGMRDTTPYEVTWRRKDGKKVYSIVSPTPHFDADGRYTGSFAIHTDITERIQIEEKLREREAFNYALFQYNPVETIAVDFEGKITAFNMAQQRSGDRLPSIGDLMYKDYAGKHEIDMRAELMKCISSGKRKEFPERKYGDKYLTITISPFAQGAIIISEDITERKRTEQALRESERFSSNLLNGSPHPIIVLNPDTSIRYVNPALEKLTGFSAADLLGRKVPYPWWSDEMVLENTRSLKQTMQRGAQRLEKQFHAKNGEPFWVEITAETLKEDRKVLYLITSWIDITQRKRAEEILQKERDTFYSILERVPSGVMVEDAHGNFSFINSEFINMTGYTLEDVPNRQEWRHRAYPDQSYRNMVLKAWENDYVRSTDREIFHKRFKRPFTRVFTVMCKDGASKEIEFRATEMGDGGMILMLTDITERQRMHELLETSASEWRTTFDAINDAVCLLDPHGKIIRCNNAMLQVMGKPFSQIINHHCWEVIHGVSEGPHNCPITLVGKTHQRETEVMFKGSRWFNISVDPLLDEDGTIFGSVHIMSDISDRMRIQNELQDSQEQLRNLTVYLQSVREQERTNIAREIHDELAQALTALKMDVSWLDNRLPSDAQSLSEKTKSMDKLIDSTIHTVKRISAELRPGVLDDLGLVAAIEWQAEEFQSRTGISCNVKVDPQDLMVDQDRSTAIFRIFQETLTNVARHAHATRVSVVLKERGERLTLRVRDNGTGITEEQIVAPQSFGLIGIRERVHPWGGKVSIKGIPGKGTTVMVNMELAHSNNDIEKS